MCYEGESCSKCCPQVEISPPAECDGSTPLPLSTEMYAVVFGARLFPNMSPLTKFSTINTAAKIDYLPMYRSSVGRVSRQNAPGLFTCDAVPPTDAQRICPCRQM